MAHNARETLTHNSTQSSYQSEIKIIQFAQTLLNQSNERLIILCSVKNLLKVLVSERLSISGVLSLCIDRKIEKCSFFAL